MARWPDVRALAAATERQVLSAWEGLGYYGRARRLLAAARRIAGEHGGCVPSARRELLALPGVGPYIASAVRSLAFGADEVALDANVARVFMRLLAVEGAASDAPARRAAARSAEDGLPPGRSAQYNQAMMDFGSLVCRPRRPLCADCILRADCRACARGMQYDIPRPVRRSLKRISVAVAVFEARGRVYLQQRPAGGLFARMWELPGGKVGTRETPAEAVRRECREELGVECAVREELTELTHFYTVFAVRLHAFLCAPLSAPPEDAAHRWVPLAELGACPVPSATRRVLDRLAARDSGQA
jgi:A/G-specific adenine glycosylase